MGKRAVDITFDPDERLWRAVDKGGLSKDLKRVLGKSLRLQVSVARSGKGRGTIESAFNPEAPPRFNGVAETTVAKARAGSNECIAVVCVDDPTANCEEHALIALVTDAVPGALSESDITRVRDDLAEQFWVVKPPT